MDNQEYRHEPILTNEDMDIAFFVRHDPRSYVTKHWHESVEIIYFLEGDADFFLDQRIISPQAGQCMVVNANVVHSSRNMNGNRSILLQIPLKVLERHLPGSEKAFFEVPLQTSDERVSKSLMKLKRIILGMKETLDKKEEGYAFRFHSLVYELLYRLYHDFRSNRAGTGEVLDTDKDRSRLGEIMDYTEMHYAREISLAEIAGVIYLQPEYFCRYFKKCMGITYLEYLNEIRLSHIYRDLTDTDLPLYRILQRHGFKNYKLFRKLFYNRFQCTPGQMREHIHSDTVREPV
ncbi:MAG TPA: helix-turn-helix transcriptional regulator [Clostridiales bacterium]|nr:helix-turn-helix transcriptional regulator [Clostridiales bacterium]